MSRLSVRDLARRWRAELLWMGLALLILSYTWMFAAISVPNERSRLYLSVAIVDHHTLTIDAPIKRFGRIFDWARFKGRAYTDKAPGSSLLAAIPYAIVRTVSKPKDWPIQRLINLSRTWLMLPLGLLGFFVMRRTVYELDLSDEVGLLAAFGWVLGTSAFHYSTALYGHQIVGVAVLVSLWLVLRAERSVAESFSRRRLVVSMLLAGLSAGVAGLTEYQAGIPCVMLTVYVVAGPLRRHPVALVAFALGALPCVLGLMAYNNAAFGSPFELSYHHLVVKNLATLHREGVGGVSLPKASLLVPVTVSLHRGLFSTAPALLLALPGAVWLWRASRQRLAVIVAVTVLFNIAFVAGTRAWFGGWSFGPRLMVPGMSWMVVGVAMAIHRLCASTPGHILARGLLIAGVVIHQSVHVVFPELPDSIKNPLLDVLIDALRAGRLSPNLMSSLFHTHGLLSLAPLAIALTIVVVRMATPWRAHAVAASDGKYPIYQGVMSGGSVRKDVMGSNMSDSNMSDSNMSDGEISGDEMSGDGVTRNTSATTPKMPPAQARRRVLIALASPWAVILWVAISFAVGPSWGPRHKARFTKSMERWERRERVMGPRARAWWRGEAR